MKQDQFKGLLTQKMGFPITCVLSTSSLSTLLKRPIVATFSTINFGLPTNQLLILTSGGFLKDGSVSRIN